MIAQEQERAARYRDVFADPVFSTLFGSRTLSIAATSLRMLALSVLVFESTGSTLLTAVAFGIGFVPQVLGGTLFGALADRWPPRALIVGGSLLEGVLAVVIAVVPMSVGILLGLVGLVSVFAPVFQGAANRLIAETLTGDAYVLGRSVSNVASAGAQLLGLAAGGFAVAALGPTRALLASAVCKLVAAAWARVGLPRLAAPSTESGQAVRRSATVTVRLLRDRPVRRLLLVQWLPPSFVTGAEAVMVPYAVERGFPDGSVGLLLGGLPVGMLVGSLVLGRFVRPAMRERLVVPILVLLGVPMLAFLAPLPLWVAVTLLFVVGVSMDYSLGLQRAFLDVLDPSVRGQAFALHFTGIMTTQGVGPLVSGALAEVTGTSVAIALMGAGAVLVAGGWWRQNSVRGQEGARASSLRAVPID